MVDQYNPWGSVTYSQIGNAFTPGTGIGTETYFFNPQTGEYSSNAQEGWEQVQGVLTPRYRQDTNLSGTQQNIFDRSQQAELNLAQLAADQSGFLGNYLNEPFEYTNRDAETWAYDLASPRILQQQQQNEAALRATLANKGIREGSAAWNAEMARMTNANTDQLNQLALTGRAQGFAEAMAQRNQPINEITALLSGSQVSNPATMSGAAPSVGLAGVDYSGLVNQNYQQQLNAYQSRMGGIGGLFGSVLGAAGQAGGFGALFSDRRLKTDIRRVGQTDGGVPIYVYRYGNMGPFLMGVMADEIEAINPEAVIEHVSGFKMVDYSEVH